MFYFQFKWKKILASLQKILNAKRHLFECFSVAIIFIENMSRSAAFWREEDRCIQNYLHSWHNREGKQIGQFVVIFHSYSLNSNDFFINDGQHEIVSRDLLDSYWNYSWCAGWRRISEADQNLHLHLFCLQMHDQNLGMIKMSKLLIIKFISCPIKCQHWSLASHRNTLITKDIEQSFNFILHYQIIVKQT